MNTKAILTLLAFLAWAWFTWSWLNDKRQECCPTTIIAKNVPTQLPIAAKDWAYKNL